MSPEAKKYTFDFVKLVVIVVASGLVSWFSNQMAVQSQFADFKEELHTFMAQERILNGIASKDIENVQVDLKEHNNRVTELEKKIFALMLRCKQTKKEEE